MWERHRSVWFSADGERDGCSWPDRESDKENSLILDQICLFAICSIICGAAPFSGNLTGNLSGQKDQPGAVVVRTLQESLNGSYTAKEPVPLNETPFTESPEAIEKAATESILELIMFDQLDNRIARGSGFVAYSDRLMITSFHVLAGMDHLTAKSEDGRKYRITNEDILWKDKDADIAICLLPEDNGLIPLPCTKEIPLRGEKVAAIGSARGITNLVTLGNVCGHWSNGVVQWLIFSAPVSAGSSGGPVINDRGEVIGVIMGSYDDSQNLNFAVPIQEVERLIEELP